MEYRVYQVGPITPNVIFSTLSTNGDLQDLIIPIWGNSFVAGRPDLETRNAHMIYVPLRKVYATGEVTYNTSE